MTTPPQANTAKHALATLERLIAGLSTTAEMAANEARDWRQVADAQRAEIKALAARVAEFEAAIRAYLAADEPGAFVAAEDGLRRALQTTEGVRRSENDASGPQNGTDEASEVLPQ